MKTKEFVGVKMDKLKRNPFKQGTKKLKNIKMFEEFSDEDVEPTEDTEPAAHEIPEFNSDSETAPVVEVGDTVDCLGDDDNNGIWDERGSSVIEVVEPGKIKVSLASDPSCECDAEWKANGLHTTDKYCWVLTS